MARKLNSIFATTPGTLADDIGTGIALAAMFGAAWLFWIATP